MIEYRILYLVRQVLLFYIVVRIIVRIFVTDAMAELLMAFVVCVLQMNGHRCLLLPHRFHRLENRLCAGIAFRRPRHIDCSLGEDELGFRHPHTFHLLRRRRSHYHGHGVRIADILRCADHDSSRDEFYILPRVEHFCQIVNGSVRIRSPHAFNKGRYRVVMLVSRLVIANHSLLNALRGSLQIDVDFPVLRRRLSRQNSQFYRIQRLSGVTARNVREELTGVRLQNGMITAHSFDRIGHRSVQKLANVLRRQRLQLKDHRP